MPSKDPRIDAYIAKSADFAKPILALVRKRVHAACPAVTETIKWGMPFFEYQGPLCFMASFKAHAAFGIWKAGRVAGAGKDESAMGQHGRLTKVADLPNEKAFATLVKQAAALNEQGIKAPPKPKREKPEAEAPADLKAALAKSKKAKSGFAGLTAAQRREYIEWILEAKREETRKKRIATTVEWTAEGKAMSWKYQ
jgi:hypothetical protein